MSELGGLKLTESLSHTTLDVSELVPYALPHSHPVVISGFITTQTAICYGPGTSEHPDVNHAIIQQDGIL